MAKLSDAQIAAVAKGAGFSGDALAIAVAVAIAESGGNPQSHNALPPDNSYGLWQINMLGSMGPERRSRYGLKSNEDLYDPTVNARVAFSLSNGGSNWKPWTTYTRGTYLLYLSRGKSVAGTATSSGTTTPATPAVSLGGLDSISKFFNQLSTPGSWVRAGLLILGVGLAFYGLLKITGDNQLSQGTKSLATGAVGLLPGGGTVATAIKAVK